MIRSLLRRAAFRVGARLVAWAGYDVVFYFNPGHDARTTAEAIERARRSVN